MSLPTAAELTRSVMAAQVAILLIAMLAHPGSAKAAAGPLSCDFSEENSPPVTTRISNLDIKGAELRFPRDYLFSRPFKSGGERDGLLLRLDVRDFSSYPKSKGYLPNGRSKISIGIRDWMQILIGSYLPMEDVLINTLSNKYKGFRQRYSGDIHKVSKEVDYNLLAYSENNQDGWMIDDIFFRLDGHRVTDVIVCSVEGQVPNPGCGHIFETGAYDVKISYARSELSRWKELRDGSAKLLQCFTVKNPTQLP